ncbi:MAG: tRNA (guanosine(37)-N1)-methyltransferase TrmD [Phycisphaerales bacterium]|nr:tRNA (guanosine(37)-N1)-methyltransferase TrmD [Phycisphaerales bacterium]MCB9854053.1 tRNA (guanosine(37)-N1)-methyltransferase TrmD [Phycisphaerales bacterium]MCB9864363.1 tRNA (guanosine(37)-N1)-methyltransferase TrmD [Phycisphaerales bacterium]
MRIDVVTLFPEVCEPFFQASIIGRAQAAGRVEIACTNLRDYSTDKHHTVDDRPFGGGPGMVLMCGPVFDAVAALEAEDPRSATRILLTPQGRRLDQSLAGELASRERLLIIAGHYEGFDERIRIGLEPLEVSIGDYVLSGGEAAAMVIVDSVVRLLPGVLGDDGSAAEDSFSIVAGESEQCLEYPQYTRPRVFRDMAVPDVLMSGDHGRIREWRKQQALERTKDRRPDLMTGCEPDSGGDQP